MSKGFKTLVTGLLSGVALSYWLKTDKGKAFSQKAQETLKHYKNNPQAFHQATSQKVADYKDLTVNTFKDVKGKFDTGELTKEDIVATVKDKVTQASDFAVKTLEQVKDQLNKTKESLLEHEPIAPEATSAQVDDIVIHYEDTHQSTKED